MRKVFLKNLLKKNRFSFNFTQNIRKKIILAGAALFAAIIIVIIAILLSGRVNFEKAKAPILEKGMISIGLRGDIPGFAQIGKNGAIEGYEADIAEEIVKRLFAEGINVQYKEINSKTGKVFIDSGELDMTLAAYVPDDSASNLIYSRPYFTDAVVFLTRNASIKSTADFKGKKVGVVTTSYAGGKLEQYFKDNHVDCTVTQYAAYPDAADALAFGNIDVFAGSRVLMRPYMEGSEVLPETIMPHGYCIAVKEDNVELKKALDYILAEIKKDGTMSRLLQKWQLTDYSKLILKSAVLFDDGEYG